MGNVMLPVITSNGSPVSIPGSVPVTDLFFICCPLPLAVDDADFIRNLFLGFWLGFIGLSLVYRAADAAGSGSGIAAAAVCHFFFPLFSSLYLLSRCLIDHVISSIQSFSPLWSDSETSFNSYSSTIWMGLCPFCCL